MVAQTPTHQTHPMDAEQIFPLIDSILPFEVCLHYQVLPLSLIDNCLILGVVDPDDHLALDYVDKFLVYRKFSVEKKEISFREQESILSAYLYHVQQNRNPDKITQKKPEHSSKTGGNNANLSKNKSSTTNLSENLSSTASAETENYQNLLNLELYTNYLNHPIEVLATLTPPHLVEELLGRVLAGGIGRLYFERQASTGRILWSQDGVLQSVLENLEASQFQGVINELKLLLELPLIPVEKSKQAEIERIYRGSHILLRLRVTSGEYGEEANLQVLRGAALKFHQQHKMAVLSRDALRLAQQLEKKLTEIEQRADSAPLPSDNLPLLTQLLHTILQQVEVLLQKDEQ